MTVKEAENAGRATAVSLLDLLPVTEAAHQVGIHPETVRRRIRAGTLRAYGHPRTLRVKLTDLLQPYRPARRTVLKNRSNMGSVAEIA